MSSFHNLSMTSIDGQETAFSAFEDKLCLVVNVASR